MYASYLFTIVGGEPIKLEAEYFPVSPLHQEILVVSRHLLPNCPHTIPTCVNAMSEIGGKK